MCSDFFFAKGIPWKKFAFLVEIQNFKEKILDVDQTKYELSFSSNM